MAKLPSGGRTRERFTFTIDKDFFVKFRVACGLVPVSRIAEELMRAWVENRPPGVSPTENVRPDGSKANEFPREGEGRREKNTTTRH